jgi:hypothetical protein
LHYLEYGVILDIMRVQMQGKLHCVVIMCWNRIGTLANLSSFGLLLIVRIFFVARCRFIPLHGIDYCREGL